MACRWRRAVGAKKSSVYAPLQKDGIQLQRTRSWCVSTDPQFAAKAADIVVGLYLAPPQKPLVLSVDEKPSIQALSRRTDGGDPAGTDTIEG